MWIAQKKELKKVTWSPTDLWSAPRAADAKGAEWDKKRGASEEAPQTSQAGLGVAGATTQAESPAHPAHEVLSPMIVRSIDPE